MSRFQQEQIHGVLKDYKLHMNDFGSYEEINIEDPSVQKYYKGQACVKMVLVHTSRLKSKSPIQRELDVKDVNKIL